MRRGRPYALPGSARLGGTRQQPVDGQNLKTSCVSAAATQSFWNTSW